MFIHKRATEVVLASTLIAAGVVSVGLYAQSRGSANRSAVAPRQEFVRRAVDEAYARYRSDTTGKSVDYIPYLAQVDSKLFGVSVVTTDNQSYSVGDTTYAFSFQSISKVFTLALAMKELGAAQISCTGSYPPEVPAMI
jgi:glutaminase